MTRSLARIVALVVLVVAACSPAPTASSTPAGTPVPSPSPAMSSAAASPAVSSAAATPTSAADLPPEASLAADGGDPVVGQLGSYTWGDGGSDSPWLPGSPIAVGSGEPLAVTLADDTTVGAWTAVRAPADSTTGAGAVAAGQGSGVIGFAVSAPGRWTVAVTINFVAGGSATWYWKLEVT